MSTKGRAPRRALEQGAVHGRTDLEWIADLRTSSSPITNDATPYRSRCAFFEGRLRARPTAPTRQSRRRTWLSRWQTVLPVFPRRTIRISAAGPTGPSAGGQPPASAARAGSKSWPPIHFRALVGRAASAWPCWRRASTRDFGWWTDRKKVHRRDLYGGKATKLEAPLIPACRFVTVPDYLHREVANLRSGRQASSSKPCTTASDRRNSSAATERAHSSTQLCPAGAVLRRHPQCVKACWGLFGWQISDSVRHGGTFCGGGMRTQFSGLIIRGCHDLTSFAGYSADPPHRGSFGSLATFAVKPRQLSCVRRARYLPLCRRRTHHFLRGGRAEARIRPPMGWIDACFTPTRTSSTARSCRLRLQRHAWEPRSPRRADAKRTSHLPDRRSRYLMASSRTAAFHYLHRQVVSRISWRTTESRRRLAAPHHVPGFERLRRSAPPQCPVREPCGGVLNSCSRAGSHEQDVVSLARDDLPTARCRAPWRAAGAALTGRQRALTMK